MGRRLGDALRRFFGGGSPSPADEHPPEVTGDDQAAQALREWLSAHSRLETTLRSGFAKKVPIDFDELVTLNGEETRAWQGFRAAHLMRDEG